MESLRKEYTPWGGEGGSVFDKKGKWESAAEMENVPREQGESGREISSEEEGRDALSNQVEVCPQAKNAVV